MKKVIKYSFDYKNETVKKLLLYPMLALILAGCGSIRFMQPDSSVLIKTNIPEEVIYKNEAGREIKIKSNANLWFGYRFLENNFKKKYLTLKLEDHPNYTTKDSVIVLKRRIRPLVLTGDIICAIIPPFIMSPFIGVDFLNGNIWKIKKKDRFQSIYFEPKIEYFDKQLERLVLTKNIDSIDISCQVSRRTIHNKVFRSKKTMKGAGVHLKRAFGFSEVGNLTRFFFWMIFAPATRITTAKGSPGIRTAASRPSPIFCRARSNTATAWAIRASSIPAMCNG